MTVQDEYAPEAGQRQAFHNLVEHLAERAAAQRQHTWEWAVVIGTAEVQRRADDHVQVAGRLGRAAGHGHAAHGVQANRVVRAVLLDSGRGHDGHGARRAGANFITVQSFQRRISH